MVQPLTQKNPATTTYPDEHILVVERDMLFSSSEAWQGFARVNEHDFTSIIEQHGAFKPRSLMEYDQRYKQIIPYLVFKHNEHIFIMQRKKTASENRLQSLYSMGIGGHIRQDDLQGKNILDWAQREFHEEICYEGLLTPQFAGFINDDSNDVGKVHLGAVYILTGSTNAIRINDEHALGFLATADECRQLYDRLENWSQILFNALHSSLFFKG